jgi:hypothetical protein
VWKIDILEPIRPTALKEVVDPRVKKSNVLILLPILHLLNRDTALPNLVIHLSDVLEPIAK